MQETFSNTPKQSESISPSLVPFFFNLKYALKTLAHTEQLVTLAHTEQLVVILLWKGYCLFLYRASSLCT